MTFRELRDVLRQDFEADEFPWDRLTISVFRLGQYANSAKKRRMPAWVLWKALDVVYMRLLIGAEMPPAVQCGPGLRLRHAGQGVILHPGVRIGHHAKLYHRVTIGVADFGGPASLGDGVYVGCGASVLGEIHVGDGARVGAGAVVVKSVPDHHVAVGVPAVARPRRARSRAAAA